MNKKTLIFVISIIFVIGIIVCFFLFFFDKNATVNDDVLVSEENTDSAIIITNKQWLCATSLDELESMIKISGNNATYDQGIVYVDDLVFANSKATYNYRIADDGSIQNMQIGHILVKSNKNDETYTMEIISAQDLKNRINIVLNWLTGVFPVDIENSYYIFDTSGKILDNNDVKSYEQILNGNASLDLRILDTDGSVWILTVQKISMYNIISCELSHYMADSSQAKIPCYVAFSE